MNRFFWALRILALLILLLAAWMASVPGLTPEIVFWTYIFLAVPGFICWPFIAYYIASVILPKWSYITTFLIILAAVIASVIFKGLILLFPIWPLPALAVAIHYFLTSPRFESIRTNHIKRVDIEIAAFALIIACAAILIATGYPALLRFRLSTAAFNSAIATSGGLPAKPYPMPQTLGTFTILDIRTDAQSGTYFLIHRSHFFDEVNYFGFAHKPSLSSSPFQSQKPGDPSILTPTGVPDWYIFHDQDDRYEDQYTY
jgi:hypothetical protein